MLIKYYHCCKKKADSHVPKSFALFILLLLQKYVPHSSSLVPTATELGPLEHIRRLLLLLLLLCRRGALPLAAQGHLVVVLLPELFGEAVVGGGVCAGDEGGGGCGCGSCCCGVCFGDLVDVESILGEELLDHGVARNVFAVAAVAPSARRSGFGSVRVDATSLAVALHLVIAKVCRVDFDEFAVAGGLIAPLVRWIAVVVLEVRRGVRGEL